MRQTKGAPSKKKGKESSDEDRALSIARERTDELMRKPDLGSYIDLLTPRLTRLTHEIPGTSMPFAVEVLLSRSDPGRSLQYPNLVKILGRAHKVPEFPEAGLEFALNQPDIKKKSEQQVQPDVAKSPIEDENLTMPEAVTPRELDATIKALEAGADARMSRFEERINLAIEEMRRDRTEVRSDIRDLQKDIDGRLRDLRVTMIVTGITVVLAIAGANIGLVQSMFGAFESGKATGTAITQATEQMKQTQEQMRILQTQLTAATSVGAAVKNESSRASAGEGRRSAKN